jgi:NitT/TauT family transport system permease protein
MVDLGKWYVRWGLSLFGAASIVLVWHLGTATFELVGPLTLPEPISVYYKYQDVDTLIWDRLSHTLVVAGIAFLISLALAVAAAVLLSANDLLRKTFMPIVVATNSVPRVTLAPLFIFYVGPFMSQYLLAAWIAFFPMLVSTFQGLTELDDDLEMLLDQLDASTWQRYKWVRLPNALPFIFDGMKLGLTLSIVGTIVVEYVATGQGIGTLAALALGNFDTALGIAVVAVTGLVSVMAFFSMFVLQSRLVHWKESSLYG